MRVTMDDAMLMKLTLFSIGIALALSLAGCGSDSPESTTSSTEVDHLAARELHDAALDARRGANGEIDLQLALDLFASAFGVDMGVPTTTLPGEAHGAQVVDAMLSHWSELSERQREIAGKALLSGEIMARWDPTTGLVTDVAPLVVQTARQSDKALSGTEGAATPIRIQELPVCGSGAPGRCTFGADIQAYIAATITTLSARLGRRLTRPILFAYDPSLEHLGAAIVTPTNADGTVVTSPGGTMEACRMVFTNVARFGSTSDAPTLRGTLVHELFHCFQNEHVLPNETPDWLDEGGAEWVAHVLQPDPRTARMLRQWLITPSQALFARSYDAMGFFLLMQQQGIDPWPLQDPMRWASRNGHDQDAYDLALPGATGRRTATLIASTRVRRGGLGADWDITDPNTPAGREVKEISLAEGESRSLVVPRMDTYGSWAAEITVTGDILTISGPASVASVGFEAAPTMTYETAINDAWCLRPEGCACPAGTQPRGTLRQGARGTVGLAIGALPGAPDPGPLDLRNWRLEAWCVQPATLPQPCDVITYTDVRLASGQPVSVPGWEFLNVRTSATRCDYVARDVVTGDLSSNTDFSLYTLIQGGALPQLPATAQSGATLRPLGMQSRVVNWSPGSPYPSLSVQILMPDGKTFIQISAGATSAASPAVVQSFLERLAELAVTRLTR
jgi:hypothetical protein